MTRGGHTRRGGNCAACHTPPDFSDFRFHNTGLSQQNYDALHGPDAFARLMIPDLPTRNRRPQDFLPASTQHPKAVGRFRSPGLSDSATDNALLVGLAFRF